MRADLLRSVRRLLLLVVIFGAAAGVISWQATHTDTGPAWLRRLAGPPQTLAGRRIGIVAGHSGNDPGAVCADGLTEASVNMGLARPLIRELERRGARVDLLDEYDERLRGYRADALVSIHADSCQVDLSGYKVASLAGGSAASERLAECLWEPYAAATGLLPHRATITGDMLNYHVFKEVAAGTPAAIIEAGFLKKDRSLLVEQPERAAAGITGGLECFLAPPADARP